MVVVGCGDGGYLVLVVVVIGGDDYDFCIVDFVGSG